MKAIKALFLLLFAGMLSACNVEEVEVKGNLQQILQQNATKTSSEIVVTNNLRRHEIDGKEEIKLDTVVRNDAIELYNVIDKSVNISSFYINQDGNIYDSSRKVSGSWIKSGNKFIVKVSIAGIQTTYELTQGQVQAAAQKYQINNVKVGKIYQNPSATNADWTSQIDKFDYVKGNVGNGFFLSNLGTGVATADRSVEFKGSRFQSPIATANYNDHFAQHSTKYTYYGYSATPLNPTATNKFITDVENAHKDGWKGQGLTYWTQVPEKDWTLQANNQISVDSTKVTQLLQSEDVGKILPNATKSKLDGYDANGVNGTELLIMTLPKIFTTDGSGQSFDFSNQRSRIGLLGKGTEKDLWKNMTADIQYNALTKQPITSYGNAWILFDKVDPKGYSFDLGQTVSRKWAIGSTGARGSNTVITRDDRDARMGAAGLIWSKFNQLKGGQVLDLMYATADQTTKTFDLAKSLSPVGNLN